MDTKQRATKSIVIASLLLASNRIFAQSPLTACPEGNTYVQSLVDKAMAMHPELKALIFHGERQFTLNYMTVASSTGQTGEKSTAEDVLVEESGRTRIDVKEAEGTVAITGQVVNATYTEIVGATTMVFPYSKWQRVASLEKKAAAIRTEMGKHILNVGNLAEPYPFSAKISAQNYANQIVEEELAKFPDLMLIALHATPPGQSQGVIVGSNHGRVGRPNAPKDDAVEKGGVTNVALRMLKHAQVLMPMKDSSGNTIGEINLLLDNPGFGKIPFEQNRTAMARRGELVRDDISRKIKNANALFDSVPSGLCR